MTTEIKDKLMKAIEAKNNDVSNFVWKFAKKSDGSQEEVRLVDATPEQLQQFLNHCNSMLYSKDKLNPGRYVLLDIINDQRKKCNVEIFLRKLGTGEICPDHKPYPRYLYLQDLQAYIDNNPEDFPAGELHEISIAAVSGNLPREFERISIADVREGCIDALGILDTKHITFSFILNLGICLTPQELAEFNAKDEEGKPRSKMEQIKERLGMKSSVVLTVKPSGLTFNELRAMINLRPKKYKDLTMDQLVTLRNKVLFRLENEVRYHAQSWEERKQAILKVAESRGIALENSNE